MLHFIAGKRLEAGRLTVVDATNVQRDARRQLMDLARSHDVLPVAIVLDVPESVCVRRNADREDRAFGAAVVRRQRDQLRRSLRGLRKEGFRTVHVLRGVEEIEAARISRERLLNDFRDQTGPFDIIGDVHGCRLELEALLEKLGYTLIRDGDGGAVDAVHPEGRKAVFVGDLVDRGPDSPGVLRLVMGTADAGDAMAVPGNHEAKLVRALRGRRVQRTHGLTETLAQLDREDAAFRARVEAFCDGLVSHRVLDGGRLVVAHAGLKEAYHARASARVRSFALYGDTTGETDEFWLPVRYPWANDYRGSAMVVYGHTPVPEPEWVNNTLCLDTGCVFGGKLSALRYPERQLVSVPAQRVWYEPAKPFQVDGGRSGGSDDVASSAGSPDRRSRPVAAMDPPDAERAPGPGAVRRDLDVLDLTDVIGKRIVETSHHGRVTVREENTAAALEVMSRYALDPRWLLYLPPTMAPCATSQRPDLLEHPDEAFDAYRRDGVTDLICQEKHMGSRAVVVVCRDRATAQRHFNAEDATGAVYTRTGRSCFSRELTEQLLSRLRAAADDAELWADLKADWLLLDCELLP